MGSVFREGSRRLGTSRFALFCVQHRYYVIIVCADIFFSIRYKSSDVEMLAEGTLPQRRVLDLAPGIGDVVGSDGKEHITRILERSFDY